MEEQYQKQIEREIREIRACSNEIHYA